MEMKCQAGCGREAEVEVWTDTWAYERGEGSHALSLCHECSLAYLRARHEQECDEMSFPKDTRQLIVVCPRCDLWHVLPPAYPKIFPRGDDDREMRVRDLVQMLQFLPGDIPVAETGWMGRDGATLRNNPFMVYEKDGVTELHIDDGQASHPSLDPCRMLLLDWYRRRL